MSFLTVYNAVYNEILNDAKISSYVYTSQIIKGANIAHPQQHYVVMIEPENESEPGNPNETYDNIKEFQYQVSIDCMLNIPAKTIQQLISGYTPNGKAFNPGILEFATDVKSAVRGIRDSYNQNNGLMSGANGSDTFALAATNKYISVSFKGKEPTGFDTIFCGDSTLSGDDIAANIQSSIRAIENRGDLNFTKATCIFDNFSLKFTISAGNIGVDNVVTVAAGASDDCSSILNFDTGTETIEGRNITKVRFGPTTKDQEYPLRIRTINCEIFEEIEV